MYLLICMFGFEVSLGYSKECFGVYIWGLLYKNFIGPSLRAVKVGQRRYKGCGWVLYK